MKQKYMTFRRIDPTPLRALDFIQPLILLARPCIAIPAAAHAMVFLWGSVMLAIEIPQIYPEKYGFNTQQVGLLNISLLVGTIVGEQVGGTLSDKWMWRREKKGTKPAVEYRLWLSYIGYVLVILGTILFLVLLDKADTWNVAPLIGAGISAAGNQIVTTIMITYALDCHPEDAAGIGVCITFVRQVWGFIGPFWYAEELLVDL